DAYAGLQLLVGAASQAGRQVLLSLQPARDFAGGVPHISDQLLARRVGRDGGVKLRERQQLGSDVSQVGAGIAGRRRLRPRDALGDEVAAEEANYRDRRGDGGGGQAEAQQRVGRGR